MLEQHYTAGGFTHSYSRNGYEWDVGVHYIGDMGKGTMVRRLFDFLSADELEWAAMDDVYDRIFIGDESFDLVAGKQKFKEAICDKFPGEESVIDTYLDMLKKTTDSMRLYTMSKLLSPRQSKLFRFATQKTIPDYCNKNTYEVLRSITDNEKLIAVLTGQWGDSGMTPKTGSFLIHSLIARHYLNGGYYPVGGASRMAETVIPQIQKTGGEVFTYASVDRILIEEGGLKRPKAIGVKMVDGQEIMAPIIVSNAGVFNTFEKLVPEKISQQLGYTKNLKTVSRSFAHLGMYIGIKKDAKSLNLPNTNFWIYPNEMHDENVEAFKQDSESEFPVVYISFPSAKDPSFSSRYPDRATIEIVAPVMYETFAPWAEKTWGKRGDDYEALKDYFSQRMLEVLYEKLPQLKGQIDYYETSTPLSTDFFCQYSKGEIYGIEHDPDRFDQSWLQPKTKISGLYLTGQDIMSCGVAGAMVGGLMTAIKILGLKKGAGLAKKIFVDNKVDPNKEWVVKPASS